MSLSRRRFFRNSGLLAASTLAFPAVVRSEENLAHEAGQKPKHIIHMVADGMSTGTLTCSDHLSQIIRKRELTWMQLYRREGTVAGIVNMRSLNSLVTDSAAASSSWGSGSRIVNGMLNVLPDGRELTSIYQVFGQKGWRRGLVTTTEVTHATPAGFVANDDSREDGETIALQYFERDVDLILGGGQKHFDGKLRRDGRDLKGEFRQKGYAVMETATELRQALVNKRWLGIFDKAHLPFTIDRNQDAKAQEIVPTLAEMTRRALENLERSEHFILQVEGGRVDQACHVGDAAAAFFDLIAFDEAIDVCLEFQKRVPDTLIVITTDHGTGNPGLNAMGSKYASSTPLFHNLTKVKASFSEIMKRLKPERMDPNIGNTYKDAAEEKVAKRSSGGWVSPEEMIAIIQETTGYQMSQKKAEMLHAYFDGKGQAIYDIMNNPYAQLSQLMGNYVGIGWAGIVHTADYVQLAAAGPGAERFRGFIQNTDVFHHYCSFAGINFKNPELPLMAERGPSAEDVEKAHWV